MTKSPHDKKLLTEIVVILVVKVIVLVVIWHSFFDQPTEIDSPKVIADKLLSQDVEQGESL